MRRYEKKFDAQDVSLAFCLGGLIGICILLILGLLSLPTPVNQDKAQIVISQQLKTTDIRIQSTTGPDPMTIRFLTGDNSQMVAICTAKQGPVIKCDIYGPLQGSQ